MLLQDNVKGGEGMAKATKEDLELINKFTRKDMTADEVYVFPIVLCSNRIDRDNEKFDDEALEKLADLYIGKTIIRDHLPSTDNQTARIFRTQVEDKGGGVKCLTAFAYLPVTEGNKEFIAQLDAGIKKEVSVGCACSRAVCSVCGKNRFKGGCIHIAGKVYGGNKCYYTLGGITDAYEVSFVAVPAQRDAGVIKSCDVRKTYIEGKITDDNKELAERILSADLKNKERKMNYEH